MADPLVVPGFGLSYKYTLEPQERFAHGIGDGTWERLTVKELAMLALMDSITDKIDWRRKVADDDIVAKWCKEALKVHPMSQQAFDWCIRELREDAARDTKLIPTLKMASWCIKSDDLISKDLQRQLKEQTQPLLSQTPKDWHPHSGETVLNLIHPSLYPIVYGRTRVTPKDTVQLHDFLAVHDSMAIIPAVETGDEFAFSQRFQWLPCDVEFVGDKGTKVRIVSYINNLRPDLFGDLYHVIEEIISHSIPAWNEVLVHDHDARTSLRIKANGPAGFDPPEKPEWINDLTTDEDDANFKRDLKKVKKYYKTPEASLPSYIQRHDDLDQHWEDNFPDLQYLAEIKFERLQRTLHPDPDLSKYDEWKIRSDQISSAKRDAHIDFDNVHTLSDEFCGADSDGEAMSAWHTSVDDFIEGMEQRCVTQASTLDQNLPPGIEDSQGKKQETPESERRSDYPVSIENQFRRQGLQVIVKLASIELSPDRPEYEGGNWHLEGTLNEHIAATAIYYFDSENITESRIHFRHEGYLDDMDLSYEQDKHIPLCEIFGTSSMRDEPALQEIGSIATPEGRLLIFPNTLQHRVDPFKLIDPSKKGHRRILVLWLVDPHYQILSSRHVPPQQHDWWITKARDEAKLDQKLPKELQEIVLEFMKEGTMTLEEAKQYRLELMAERVVVNERYEADVETYNLCEH